MGETHGRPTSNAALIDAHQGVDRYDSLMHTDTRTVTRTYYRQPRPPLPIRLHAQTSTCTRSKMSTRAQCSWFSTGLLCVIAYQASLMLRLCAWLQIFRSIFAASFFLALGSCCKTCSVGHRTSGEDISRLLADFAGQGVHCHLRVQRILSKETVNRFAATNMRLKKVPFRNICTQHEHR